MKYTSAIVLLSLALAGVVSAAEPAEKHPQPKPSSAELERMKALAGTWKGKTDMGGSETEITVQYRIVSGGSAVEEKIFEGTPHEMVTMYYDKNGKLALTHYCALGNRPGLVLKSSDPKKMEFDFDATCGVDEKTEMHMHSLAISFDGPDTMTQTWQLFDAGKSKEHHPFVLKRVKS
jgi:hypothetical protein